MSGFRRFVISFLSEMRANDWYREGPKSSIRSLSSSITANTLTPSSRSKSTSSSYIAIVSPPLKATAASNSATIRNYANNSTAPTNEMVAKLTIFDLKNKFVAFTATFQEGICEIWEAWGSIWVLTEAGKVRYPLRRVENSADILASQFYRINEQPIANSLSTLFSRNLYTLAISLALSRGLSVSEIGEIYRRYGDHLYGKGDFEGAMDCYLKTVGTVQASYVIRKVRSDFAPIAASATDTRVHSFSTHNDCRISRRICKNCTSKAEQIPTTRRFSSTATRN